MRPLRILLVDDHEVVRTGLRYALGDLPAVDIVGEAADGEEAVRQCRQLVPDVVIMDIRMPGAGGIKACREIIECWPSIKVIVLTSYSDDNLIALAIQAGAAGYVLKSGETKHLISALEAVARGEALLDPIVTQRLLIMMRQGGKLPNPLEGLTPREMEVLRLVARGQTNVEIADKLFLSEKTIRNQVSLLLGKLQVNNRVEAAALLLRWEEAN
jgi:two-component system, NarL family, response regulator DevR